MEPSSSSNNTIEFLTNGKNFEKNMEIKLSQDDQKFDNLILRDNYNVKLRGSSNISAKKLASMYGKG
jgi:hypothetical protein